MRSFHEITRWRSRFRRNNRHPHDIISQGRRQSPETRLAHYRDIHEHGGCRYAQADFLNRHNRYGVRCCSVSCVVAFRYAIAGDHCPIVDQRNRDDGGLQGSAPNRGMGGHLKFSCFSLSTSSFLSRLGPGFCRGFLYVVGKVTTGCAVQLDQEPVSKVVPRFFLACGNLASLWRLWLRLWQEAHRDQRT